MSNKEKYIYGGLFIFSILILCYLIIGTHESTNVVTNVVSDVEKIYERRIAEKDSIILDKQIEIQKKSDTIQMVMEYSDNKEKYYKSKIKKLLNESSIQHEQDTSSINSNDVNDNLELFKSNFSEN